jgi:hypothetical protein
MQCYCKPLDHLRSLTIMQMNAITTLQVEAANHELCHCIDDAAQHCRSNRGKLLTMNSVTALVTSHNIAGRIRQTASRARLVMCSKTTSSPIAQGMCPFSGRGIWWWVV